MASHTGFVDYVTEQLQQAGTIRAKKMFGEYGLYCDEVFFAMVCDDQLFLKVTPQGEAAFPALPKAPPYAGAKDAFLIEDLEDRALLTALAQVTCQALSHTPQKKGQQKPCPSITKKSTKSGTFPPKSQGSSQSQP